MKRNIMRITILALGLFALLSCEQGPIFFTISRETPPEKPRIAGAPTNMVLFERKYPDPENASNKITVPILFVASGRIHWYANDEWDKTPTSNGTSRWDMDFGSFGSIPQPGGRVIALAVAKDYLYALSFPGYGLEARLYRLSSTYDANSEKWERVESPYSQIQSIYADPEQDQVFAGVRTGSGDKDGYAILYLDDSTPTKPELKRLMSDTALLSGAASDGTNYYLSTRGKGIFQIAETSLGSTDPSGLSGSENRTFMGMIKLEDGTIVAVERSGGAIFKVNGTPFEQMKYTVGDSGVETGRYATGALALWTNGSDKLLVAGIQGGLYNTTTSAYSHGYVEFVLDGTGIDRRRDPGAFLTAPDKEQYTSSIGTKPINHLFQAPSEIDPENKTFFASTQNAGLFSYRNRYNTYSGKWQWQWNAEN